VRARGLGLRPAIAGLVGPSQSVLSHRWKSTMQDAGRWVLTVIVSYSVHVVEAVSVNDVGSAVGGVQHN
jgi:hypothetical protein